MLQQLHTDEDQQVSQATAGYASGQTALVVMHKYLVVDLDNSGVDRVKRSCRMAGNIISSAAVCKHKEA